jgi:4-hydroxybenzoate polyprenyltransferase
MTSAVEPIGYPLIVDLDGTLLLTDTLWEAVLRLVVSKPLTAILIPIWMLRGKAYFKAKVANQQPWQPRRIPLNEPLVEYLQAQRAIGRTIILATAAHRSIAQVVASHLDIFSSVLATDSAVNLEGIHKLEAIVKTVGPQFSYAGNANADIPIWKKAQSAIVVSSSTGLVDRVSKLTRVEQHFVVQGGGWRGWMKAIRVHQWLKNLLVFVPLVTSLTFFQPDHVLHLIECFLAFCAVASGTYIANDLFDLDHDRAHASKRYRPLANGAIELSAAIAVSVVLVTSGLLVTAAINWSLSLILSAYLFLTLAYSLVLKRHVVADMTALAALYTLRIIAGAYAINVPLSQWLLTFSCLLFFGLAALKRCTELSQLEDPASTKTAPGRDYKATDLRVLWPMGVAASFSSVVVFELFMVSQAAATAKEPMPWSPASWITSILLLYWLTRLWIKTSRGEMNDDPIVYAIRDRGSRITVLAIVLFFVAARLPNAL